MSDGDYKRIHFISDFETYDPSHEPKVYRCLRCDREMIGEEACYEHRKGFIPECLLNRFNDWYNMYIRRVSQNASEADNGD